MAILLLGFAMPDPARAADTPEDALAALAAELLPDRLYIGDCEATEPPPDFDGLCSIFRSERNGLLAYWLGIPRTDAVIWVILVPGVDGWSVVHAAPVGETGPDAPPWP